MAGAVLLSQVMEELERQAPLPLAESWDNVGLLLGDPQQQCERGLTCLTLTPDVAEEALQRGVQVIVTHHPILFRPVQRLTSETAAGEMLLKLIRAGIAVYAPHTAYDSAQTGVNQQLADLLEVRNAAVLRAKSDGTGAGRWGELSAPMTLQELLTRVKSRLQIENLQYVGDLAASVQCVGIACGSAAEFLPDAAAAGCQVLLTGEARFHDALRARELGLAMILAGHYATERFALESLAGRLHASFPQMEWMASAAEHDPVCFG